MRCVHLLDDVSSCSWSNYVIEKFSTRVENFWRKSVHSHVVSIFIHTQYWFHRMQLFLMSNRIRWKSNKVIESRASGRKLLIIYTFKLCMFASSKIKDIGNNLSALWLPLSVEKYFCQTVMYNCNFRAYEEIVIVKLLIMLHDSFIYSKLINISNIIDSWFLLEALHL